MLHHIDDEFLRFPFRILPICHSFYNFPLNWQVSLRSALFQPLVLKLYSNETRSLVKETLTIFSLSIKSIADPIIGCDTARFGQEGSSDRPTYPKGKMNLKISVCPQAAQMAVQGTLIVEKWAIWMNVAENPFHKGKASLINHLISTSERCS